MKRRAMAGSVRDRLPSDQVALVYKFCSYGGGDRHTRILLAAGCCDQNARRTVRPWSIGQVPTAGNAPPRPRPRGRSGWVKANRRAVARCWLQIVTVERAAT